MKSDKADSWEGRSSYEYYFVLICACYICICSQDVSVSLRVSVNICEMRLWQNGSVKFVLRELRSRLFQCLEVGNGKKQRTNASTEYIQIFTCGMSKLLAESTAYFHHQVSIPHWRFL